MRQMNNLALAISLEALYQSSLDFWIKLGIKETYPRIRHFCWLVAEANRMGYSVSKYLEYKERMSRGLHNVMFKSQFEL